MSSGKSIIVSMELASSTAVPDLDIFVSNEQFETLIAIVGRRIGQRRNHLYRKPLRRNMRESDYGPD